MERLKRLIEGSDLIVAPVALNAIMARLAEEAGFKSDLSERRIARVAEMRNGSQSHTSGNGAGGGGDANRVQIADCP